MKTRSIIILIVVVALAVVVIVLAVNLVNATNENQTPSSASPTATATETATASPTATATETATPSPTESATPSPTGDTGGDGEPIVHVTSAEMTSGVNSDGSPTDNVTQYAPEDKLIASVEIDTTDPDPVRFVWYYNGDSFDDDTVNADNGYANCELQSQHTWDPGDYQVEVYLQDSTDPDATLDFSVAVPDTPSASPSASASA